MNIGIGRSHDGPHFGRFHFHFGFAEQVGGSGFNLHNHQPFAIAADNIQFVVAKMPVAVQDLVPDLTEMLFGQVLTLLPKFVVFGHVWRGLLMFQCFNDSSGFRSFKWFQKVKELVILYSLFFILYLFV